MKVKPSLELARIIYSRIDFLQKEIKHFEKNHSRLIFNTSLEYDFACVLNNIKTAEFNYLIEFYESTKALLVENALKGKEA